MAEAPVVNRGLGWVVAVVLAGGVAVAQAPMSTKPVATTRRAPNEFGTTDYAVTTIGAGSFTPARNDNAVYPPYVTEAAGTGGGIFRVNHGPNGDAHYYGTVSVPSGAVIDFIGLQGFTFNDGVSSATLSLVDRYGAVTPIVQVAIPDQEVGTVYNDSALGFQLARNVHNLLVLDVENDANEFYSSSGFAWVEIWWRRTVSPPPATATFTDVPTSHPAFQYIEALAASGITGGCGGGNYCPDAPLNRRQMAVFLSKGFGLHWPY